jgi:hypothetical protein
MSTKIKKDTTVTVKTFGEAETLVREAFNTTGLKSINVFVWADPASGIEVKTSFEFNEPETAS